MGIRRRALLVLAAVSAGGVHAQTCDTVSQVVTTTLTASDGPGFSHAVANVASGDVLFAQEPTAADVRRAPFVHAGAGRLAGILPEPSTPGVLPDLVLQRGVQHELQWPRDGACAIVAKPAAFSLVDITRFFTRDSAAKVTRALVPADYDEASLQYQCQNANLGLLAGTIHVAKAATARLLHTLTQAPDAVYLRAPLESAVAYGNALELRVQTGYMGPEGVGFVQRIGAGGAWAAGTELRAHVVAGATLAQQAQGAHMALLLTKSELRSAEDWQDLVCGTPATGAHAVYEVCRDAQGAPVNAHVVDGTVVPLWRSDACSLLRPRVQIQSVDSTGLLATPATPAESKHEALWSVPALAGTRRLCVPGADPAAQEFPCRWPEALASPFPADGGPAGPYFFDRVLVPERGWLLVCVGAGNVFAHADALRVAPNAPADPYAFTAAQFVYGGVAPNSRGYAHTCPGGSDYTHERGVVTWTPGDVSAADASADLWVYAIFTLGDSDACQSHACDASAVSADSSAYLSTPRATSSLVLFEGTTFDVRAVAPDAGAARRRAPAMIRVHEQARALTARRHLYTLHDLLENLRPLGVPGRALLAVEAGAAAQDASGAILTQDVTSVDAARMVEHSVCREFNKKHCVAVRAEVRAQSLAEFCQPESKLIEVLRPRLASIVENMQLVVVGVHRPDYDALCTTGVLARRLLTLPTVNAKLVVAADGMIERIVFLENELTKAQASGVRVEAGASAASIMTVARNEDEFLLGKGLPATVARDGTSGWSATVIVAVVAGGTAGLAIIAVAVRYCALYHKRTYAPLQQNPQLVPPPPTPKFCNTAPNSYPGPPNAYPGPPNAYPGPPNAYPGPPNAYPGPAAQPVPQPFLTSQLVYAPPTMSQHPQSMDAPWHTLYQH